MKSDSLPLAFKSFTTQIEAVVEGEILFYSGPVVIAPSLEAAQDYVRSKLPFATISGEMVNELPYGSEITHGLHEDRKAILFLN